MATIIVLSDIHGNLPALKAAWRDIDERPRHAVYCLGDIAAFGPHPAECVAFLRDTIKPDVCILGNTDRYLIESAADRKSADRPKELQAALDWARDALSKEDIAWLKKLPAEKELTIEGLTFRLVHASPGDDEVGISAETSAEELDRLFADAGNGATFCGHTHLPFRARVSGHQIINAGSIGLPYDGDQRAGFIRTKIIDGAFVEFERRRVSYPVRSTVEDLRSRDVPMADTISRRLRFAEMVSPTRSGLESATDGNDAKD